MLDKSIDQTWNASSPDQVQQGLIDTYLSVDSQPDGFKVECGVLSSHYPLHEEPPARVVHVPADTPLFCHHCHDTEAQTYRLRRKAGKYVALCHKPESGEGCWERDATPMCKYEDHQGVQCTNVAEFTVAYGKDMLVKTYRCLIHVAPALIDVSEHRIFPV